MTGVCKADIAQKGALLVTTLSTVGTFGDPGTCVRDSKSLETNLDNPTSKSKVQVHNLYLFRLEQYSRTHHDLTRHLLAKIQNPS